MTEQRPPRPNVLADEAPPNQLSAQPTGMGRAGPGRVPGPRVNQVVVHGRPAQPSVATDTRFERRGRRTPSLATVIVIGFLLVTVFRVVGSIAGRFLFEPPPATTAPGFASGADLERGTVAFGAATDGLCGVGSVESTFDGRTDIWWTAHLTRSLTDPNETLVEIVQRDGVDVEQGTTSGLELGANGSDVVCSIKPRDDTTAGAYVLQLWDADQRQLLAFGQYTITG